jgi:hypothetical protein
VAQTVEFCHSADITAPMLFVTPYPGTPLFQEAVQLAHSGLRPTFFPWRPPTGCW